MSITHKVGYEIKNKHIMRINKKNFCKYKVHNWFGYGSYKIFCENFIFFEGGDVVTGESNYRCRSVTELIA